MLRRILSCSRCDKNEHQLARQFSNYRAIFDDRQCKKRRLSNRMFLLLAELRNQQQAVSTIPPAIAMHATLICKPLSFEYKVVEAGAAAASSTMHIAMRTHGCYLQLVGRSVRAHRHPLTTKRPFCPRWLHVVHFCVTMAFYTTTQ